MEKKIKQLVYSFKACFVKHENILRWLLALLMLSLVGRVVSANAENLHRLRDFHPQQLLFVYSLFVVYLFLHACSSYIIVRSVDSVTINLWEWIKIFIVGRFANTLFAQSGNLYRATVLKKQHHLSFSAYANVQVFFVWLETLISLGLAFLLASFSRSPTMIAGIGIPTIVGLLMSIIFIGPFVAKIILDKWGYTPGVIDKIHKMLNQMLSFILNRGTDLRLIARITLINLVVFIVWVLLYQTAFEGLGIRIRLGDLALFLAIYKLSTFLMITPGNMGVREAAYALLGQAVGISMAQGIMVSVVLRIVGYTILLPTGFVWGGAQLFEAKRRGNQEKESIQSASNTKNSER